MGWEGYQQQPINCVISCLEGDPHDSRRDAREAGHEMRRLQDVAMTAIDGAVCALCQQVRDVQDYVWGAFGKGSAAFRDAWCFRARDFHA